MAGGGVVRAYSHRAPSVGLELVEQLVPEEAVRLRMYGGFRRARRSGRHGRRAGSGQAPGPRG
ncbi:hypothetical protein TOK_1726 [Pseudonocardia sp. N23]|nr:hypothetical protein TOK_1726 [Pseudonocardia sp. N23]